MRQLMRTILALWFAITMTLAQSCLDTTAGANPYSSSGKVALNSSGNGASGSGFSGGSGASVTPVASHLDTTGYTASQAESQALTDYLKQHRLPLVGAQVLHGPNAQRAVVLYGYVGSELGKRDATAKAANYLNDPKAAIDNRVMVRPEILAGTGSGSAPDATAASSGGEPEASNVDNSAYPGADSYVDQQNEAQQQYAQQQQGLQSGVTVSGGMVPLAMILGLMALSAASSGSSFSMGPGSSGLSGGAFGPPPPYNPYPGYASPPPPNSSYGP
jgi:hypothetical protein